MKYLIFLCSILTLSLSTQDDYLKRANDHFAKGEYLDAIRYYKAHHASIGANTHEEKIEQAEECHRLTLLADLLFKELEVEKAEIQYAKILEINPNDPHAQAQYDECVSLRPVRTIFDDVYDNMVLVAGDTFLMGSRDNDAYSDEKVVHQVTLSDFKISKYQVTQKLWNEVMGMERNLSEYKGDDLPVTHVSWNEAIEFIQELNLLTEKRYRLPTEAEWEFAARGGINSKGYRYAGSNEMDDVGWFAANSDDKPHPVGAIKRTNELGLFDMSGNVYEWCSDWYSAYSEDAKTNPKGPSTGLLRVFRGGCWNRFAWYSRVSSRSGNLPGNRFAYVGFRLCLDP